MLNYKLNNFKIAKAISKGAQVNILTPNNFNITLEKGVFIPDGESFDFIKVAEDLILTNLSIKTIADIGTGSGIIAISLGKKFKDKTIYAYDISLKALTLAQKNAEQNEVLNIIFLHNKKGEWLNSNTPDEIDFIISNPPYVGDDEFNSPEFKKIYPDYKYQPETSIRSYDRNGIEPYVSIIGVAKIHKTKYILFRVNPNKIDTLVNILNKRISMNIKKIKAENGNEEFLFITLN